MRPLCHTLQSGCSGEVYSGHESPRCRWRGPECLGACCGERTGGNTWSDGIGGALFKGFCGGALGFAFAGLVKRFEAGKLFPKVAWVQKMCRTAVGRMGFKFFGGYAGDIVGIVGEDLIAGRNVNGKAIAMAAFMRLARCGAEWGHEKYRRLQAPKAPVVSNDLNKLADDIATDLAEQNLPKVIVDNEIHQLEAEIKRKQVLISKEDAKTAKRNDNNIQKWKNENDVAEARIAAKKAELNTPEARRAFAAENKKLDTVAVALDDNGNVTVSANVKRRSGGDQNTYAEADLGLNDQNMETIQQKVKAWAHQHPDKKIKCAKVVVPKDVPKNAAQNAENHAEINLLSHLKDAKKDGRPVAMGVSKAPCGPCRTHLDGHNHVHYGGHDPVNNRVVNHRPPALGRVHVPNEARLAMAHPPVLHVVQFMIGAGNRPRDRNDRGDSNGSGDDNPNAMNVENLHGDADGDEEGEHPPMQEGQGIVVCSVEEEARLQQFLKRLSQRLEVQERLHARGNETSQPSSVTVTNSANFYRRSARSYDQRSAPIPVRKRDVTSKDPNVCRQHPKKDETRERRQRKRPAGKRLLICAALFPNSRAR